MCAERGRCGDWISDAAGWQGRHEPSELGRDTDGIMGSEGPRTMVACEMYGDSTLDTDCDD